MVSPVYFLMLSIQAVRGLPRLRAPGIVPCIISFSRKLPCLAHSLADPTGLYILPMFFNDLLETNYLMIYWTDFRDLFYQIIGIWSQIIDLTLFFLSLKGYFHGNQLRVKISDQLSFSNCHSNINEIAV